jgi:DsbC/DsbD-like thiol-disulfide interchange protein
MMQWSRKMLALAALATAAVPPPVDGVWAASELASPWSEGKAETRSRLVAGEAGGKTVAAVEIAMAEGWKTYWRFPGDAGGVPPMFDFAKSENVAAVKVLFPVPKRFTDKTGDTLGYKSAVVFPLLIEATDASKPVALKLALEYGICREVCVPVEAALNLDIPAGAKPPLAPHVMAALDHVPHGPGALTANDPRLVKSEVKLDGPNPAIALEVECPGGAANADAYVESPAGYYIPLPKAGSAKPAGKDRVRFEIDLKDAVDPADLKGKTANVTLVCPQGVSEAAFKLE